MPREPKDSLELDPKAYDDPKRDDEETSPVTGDYQDVGPQDEVD